MSLAIRPKLNRGYNVVEALVYIALLALLVVALLTVLFSIMRSYGQFRATRAILAAAGTTFGRLSYEIGRATAVAPEETVWDSSPGQLGLNAVAGGETVATVFAINGSQLAVAIDGGVPGALVPPAVSVERLVFRLVEATTTQAIQVELTLTARYGQTSRTESFTNTYVLRGRY